MSAAAHWCRGGAPDPEAQRQALRGLGIPNEIAQQMTAPAEQTEFAVWPSNWPGLRAFCAMSSQWLYALTGQRIGLRYEGLAAVMDMLGIAAADRADTFAAVQTCERAALDYWMAQA